MGMYQIDDEAAKPTLFGDRPQLPYLIPFMAFVLCMVPGSFGTALGVNWESLWFRGLPLVYTIKTVIAAGLLAWLWRYYTPIRWTHLGLGIAAGVLGLGLWIGLERGTQGLWHALGQSGIYPRIFGGGDAKIYDPVAMLPNLPARYAFYAVRLLGPTLVVPVMEELFFRDFLMRALIRGARFQEVAVGTFTWGSLLGMSLLFAAGHYQWPSGFAYGLLMGLLVIRTKSLGACIVAHGTTNLLLGLYVLATGDWQYW